jgi:hypothetical protein
MDIKENDLRLRQNVYGLFHAAESPGACKAIREAKNVCQPFPEVVVVLYDCHAQIWHGLIEGRGSSRGMQ